VTTSTRSADPGRRDLRALPKANLHLHLTGSMRPATLTELARCHGLAVPPPLQPGTAHAWPAFQGRYDAARAAIRTADDLGRVVREAIEDSAADGCGWLELQLDPASYAPLLGAVETVLDTVLAAAAGTPTAVVVTSSWARPGADAERLARLAARYAQYGVVGFGLSNDERLGRVEEFVGAFRIARDAGLRGVPHGGFYTPARQVRACVERLGAARIGHGVTAAGDAPTLDLLAARGVALEFCPTSYPPFGVAEVGELPVRTFLDAGVRLALANDDPLLFGADVTEQYRIVRDLGLSDAELAELARQSIAASAAPPSVRGDLLARVGSWLGGEIAAL
jgi:adenosine deaminase